MMVMVDCSSENTNCAVFLFPNRSQTQFNYVKLQMKRKRDENRCLYSVVLKNLYCLFLFYIEYIFRKSVRQNVYINCAALCELTKCYNYKTKLNWYLTNYRRFKRRKLQPDLNNSNWLADEVPYIIYIIAWPAWSFIKNSWKLSANRFYYVFDGYTELLLQSIELLVFHLSEHHWHNV